MGLLEDYMSYMPKGTITARYKTTEPKLITWANENGADIKRGQAVIDKLDDLDASFPDLIKEAIWKLQVIRFVASKYASNSITDLNILEKISNYAIKAKLEDYSTWGEVDYSSGLEVSVISNEHKLDINWVIAVGNGSLKSLEEYAKSLRDKVSLRDNIKEVNTYVDWSKHCERCLALGVNPKDYTEKDALDLEVAVKEVWEIK